MDSLEAAYNATHLGWHLSSGAGDELFAVNPKDQEDNWVYSGGKWFQGVEVREQIPPCR